MNIAQIYIPVPNSFAATVIDAGSGIVSLPRKAGVQVIYYEGNRYKADNLRNYEDRIRCAAGRLFSRYPTSALVGFDVDDIEKNLVHVGSIDESYRISFLNEDAARAYARSAQQR